MTVTNNYKFLRRIESANNSHMDLQQEINIISCAKVSVRRKKKPKNYIKLFSSTTAHVGKGKDMVSGKAFTL